MFDKKRSFGKSDKWAMAVAFGTVTALFFPGLHVRPTAAQLSSARSDNPVMDAQTKADAFHEVLKKMGLSDEGSAWPSASTVLVTEFGTANGSAATVQSGDLRARIVLSDVRAVSGEQLGVMAEFEVAPGWHVYGKPLPAEYTPTTVTFDEILVSSQKLEFPRATPVKFELLGETLPVYQGNFKAVGEIIVRQKLNPGEYKLGGTLSFQECNDNLCKMPQQVRFEVPLRVEAMVPATPR